MDNPLTRLDPGLFIWTVVTFLLLLGILTKYAWKPLLKMLEQRENRIQDSLKAAQEAREETERLQAESKAILAQAHAHAQDILAQGKVAARKLKEETLQEAKDKAQALIREAETRIEMEKQKALHEVRTEVVDLSLHIARKLIQKNLTTEDNLTLINDSLRELDTLHEARS
jgi:F-type H+-transporting ATPase subunit b